MQKLQDQAPPSCGSRSELVAIDDCVASNRARLTPSLREGCDLNQTSGHPVQTTDDAGTPKCTAVHLLVGGGLEACRLAGSQHGFLRPAPRKYRHFRLVPHCLLKSHKLAHLPFAALGHAKYQSILPYSVVKRPFHGQVVELTPSGCELVTVEQSLVWHTPYLFMVLQSATVLDGPPPLSLQPASTASSGLQRTRTVVSGLRHGVLSAVTCRPPLLRDA